MPLVSIVKVLPCWYDEEDSVCTYRQLAQTGYSVPANVVPTNLVIQYHVNSMGPNICRKLPQELQDVLYSSSIRKTTQTYTVSDVSGRHKLLR